MVTIRNETEKDVDAREALLDRVWGEERFRKTAQRLREGRIPAEGLSLVAGEGDAMVGTVRLWHVNAGPARRALLLGPLAVDAGWRGLGIGVKLVRRVMDAARALGHDAILLVGDAAYYGRFGFSSESTAALWLPGPYRRERLLGCELVRGTLDGARGLVSATGKLEPQPALATVIAALPNNERVFAPRAA
jgi:predicted N-acetyltransferase YhbS